MDGKAGTGSFFYFSGYEWRTNKSNILILPTGLVRKQLHTFPLFFLSVNSRGIRLHGDVRVERSYHKQWAVPLWPAPPLSSKTRTHPACRPERETETEERLLRNRLPPSGKNMKHDRLAFLFQRKKMTDGWDHSRQMLKAKLKPRCKCF